jgi:putative RecB family exonuclease
MSDVRSFSQYNTYIRCPYSYYLARVEKVWNKPAAWLPMGTAVHEAAEKWELSDRTMSMEEAKDVFRASYTAETNRYLGETPNPAYWFGSGPYRGATDIQRRFKLGLEHVERYIAYYTANPSQLPYRFDDGKLAIELPFTIDMDGVKVRGFIDWVGYDASGDLVVRDNKTGNKPGGPDQLSIYALAVEKLTGHLVTKGDFFMTKTGKPTRPYELTEVVKLDIIEGMKMVDEAIKAEKFPALPEASKCMFCSVRDSCTFKV